MDRLHKAIETFLAIAEKVKAIHDKFHAEPAVREAKTTKGKKKAKHHEDDHANIMEEVICLQSEALETQVDALEKSYECWKACQHDDHETLS